MNYKVVIIVGSILMLVMALAYTIYNHPERVKTTLLDPPNLWGNNKPVSFNTGIFQSQTQLILTKHTGLEKFLFNNPNAYIDGNNIIITADINVSVFTFLKDAYQNPTVQKCNVIKNYAEGAFDNLTCTELRDLITDRIQNGWKQFKDGVEDGRIILNGTQVTAIYSTGGQEFRLGDNSIVYSFSQSAGQFNVNTTTQPNNDTHLSINYENAPYTNLVAYWSFDADSTTTAYDLSNNSYDGTYTGGNSSNPVCGLYDDGACFDGLNDYILISDIDTDQIGVCAWINPLNNSHGIVSKRSQSGATWSWQLYHQNDNGIQLYIQNATGATANTPALAGANSAPINKWSFVCGTYNGTTMNAYINGSLVGTAAQTGNIRNTADTVRIGWTFSDTFAFNGSIDEVMMFNTALTQQQITDIYNNQSVRFHPRGESIIKQIVVNNTNGKLDLIWDDFEMKFGSNITTNIGTWNISSGYNNTDDNLVGYWHLDSNNGTINYTADSSGNGYNGQCSGMGSDCSLDAGQYNHSFMFDGVNDIVTLPDISQIWDGSTNTMTVSAWAKTNNISAQQAIHSKYNSQATGVGLNLFAIEATGKFRLFQSATDTSNWVQWQTTNQVIFDNEWHHLSAVVNLTSGVGILYLDGISVASTKTTTGTPPTVFQNSATTNKFGKYTGASGTDAGFINGDIDEVMLWNKPLTANEIKSLYTKGRANWIYTAEQNLTNINATRSNNTFDIHPATTNILTQINLISTGTTNFYTPWIKSGGSIVLYGAITDVNSPKVFLISPLNSTNTESNITYFIANHTELSIGDSGLQNTTFNIWNSTLDLINQTTISLTGSVQTTNITFTLPYFGLFYWNHLTCDTLGQCAWNNTNYTVNYISDATKPIINFTSPTEISLSSIARQIITNVTASDANFKNITVNFFNASGKVFSSYSTASQYYNQTIGLADGQYFFNAAAFDTFGNQNSTETRNVTIDTTGPVCTIVEPRENDIYSGTNTTLTVTCTDTLSSVDDQWFNLNSTYQNIYKQQLFSSTYIMGINQTNNYTVYAYANDTLNNVGAMVLRNFRFVFVNSSALVGPPGQNGSSGQNGSVGPAGPAGVNGTSSNIIICKQSKLGYFNPNIAGLLRGGCIRT